MDKNWKDSVAVIVSEFLSSFYARKTSAEAVRVKL